jgi:hypothetical protein
MIPAFQMIAGKPAPVFPRRIAICDAPQAGRFSCEDCEQPVHEWRERYSFSDWRPVTNA